MLTSLPGKRGIKKYILTNCAEKQALESLQVLGLAEEFEGNVYGADAMGEVCKPEVAAFEKIIAASGIDPKRTAFFEDSVGEIPSTLFLFLLLSCECERRWPAPVSVYRASISRLFLVSTDPLETLKLSVTWSGSRWVIVPYELCFQSLCV